MANPSAVEFVVTGDPAVAKATGVQALESRKFRLKWTSEWAGIAERGNKIANILVGAMAQYFKIGITVSSLDAGRSIIRLDRLSSGWMGSVIGAVRTKKNFEKLTAELSGTFGAAGVLQETRTL